MINFSLLFLFIDQTTKYFDQFGLIKVDGSVLPIINFYIFDEMVNTR